MKSSGIPIMIIAAPVESNCPKIGLEVVLVALERSCEEHKIKKTTAKAIKEITER
jgi:hypothetical protein